MTAGELAHGQAELRRWGHQPHIASHRLDHHRGDGARIGMKGIFQRLGVIIGQNDGVLGAALGYSRAGRHPQGGGSGTGGHQQGIDMTVVTAGEFHHLVTPGGTACQSQRAHGCLGATADKAHPFHGWDGPQNQLRQARFSFGGCPEAAALCQGFSHSPNHRRMTVTKDEWPPRTDVIEVAVAIEVKEPGPLAPVDKEGLTPNGTKGAGRAVHAPRDQGSGTGKGGAACGSALHRWLNLQY